MGKENKKLQLNQTNGLWALYIASAVGLLIFYLYFCKNTVLGCHDSLVEFCYAKILGWQSAYKTAYRFSSSRGRISFIFPLIICLRYFVHEKGNFLAIWLLQYVPVYANVFLLGGIIAKKTRKEYGVMMVLFFMTFLQINTGHSLIICYPLDFMYGLFISILGLCLFESYLNKPKVWKMILSVLFYYESIMVYEAFIVSALCYAILALNNVKRSIPTENLKVKFIRFVRSLIPHIVISLCFLGGFMYLRSHPLYPEIAVIDISNHGNLKDALKCWALFSTGMLPLRNFFEVRSVTKTEFFNITFIKLLITFFSGIGSLSGTGLIFKNISTANETAYKKINRALLAIAFCGLSVAVFFPLPHSLTYDYQDWVRKGVMNYLPSSISYYGWVVFIVCISCFVLNLLSKKTKNVRIIAAVVVCFLFSIGSYMTVCTNNAYKQIEASNGFVTSDKAQAYYSMCMSDSLDEWDIDYLYIPSSSYSGMHFNMQNAESIMDFTVNDQDISFANEANFLETYSYFTNPAMLIYDDDSKVAYIVPISDVSANEDGSFEVYSADKVLVTSPHGGNYELISSGNIVSDFKEDSWSEAVIDIPVGTPVSSLDIITK